MSIQSVSGWRKHARFLSKTTTSKKFLCIIQWLILSQLNDNNVIIIVLNFARKTIIVVSRKRSAKEFTDAFYSWLISRKQFAWSGGVAKQSVKWFCLSVLHMHTQNSCECSISPLFVGFSFQLLSFLSSHHYHHLILFMFLICKFICKRRNFAFVIFVTHFRDFVM